MDWKKFRNFDTTTKSKFWLDIHTLNSVFLRVQEAEAECYADFQNDQDFWDLAHLGMLS